jgi:CheY-like chemotaxis protein
LARKILLADDSVTAQNMGRKILADAGYEVITVNNGSAALKRIAELKPDLIVLDVYMPGYSGLEVCQRLKDSGETARIPVVLTVGKLEPFKPEEAKRVRADGFIVKPFEASELLSALSKLEDRIVPRSEPAKPGRFARANAALDAAYDKTVAATEEDSGWKNRINFPTKKKAAEPEYVDDPAVYNPVNKDLRTTVDHKKASKPQEIQEEARVDLGALAPEGLPKDVTPEEIAALAAAAAQVKGKLSDAEAPAAELVAKPVEAKAEEIKTPEIKTEDKAESKVASEPPQETAPAAAEPVSKSEPVSQTEPISQPDVPVSVPAEAPSIAASAELKPVAAISAGAHSGNGAGTHEADEPVTMAVAAGAEYAVIPARWKAVPVAVLAEEAALSLEEEMRKALAAVAAAEMAQPVSAMTLASAAPEAGPVAVAQVQSAVAGPAAEPSHVPAVVSIAPDAISEAVKDLEAVAASYPEFHKAVPLAVEPEPVVAAMPRAGSVEPEKTEAAVAAITAPTAEEPKPKAEVVELPHSQEKYDPKVAETKADESRVEAAKVDEERIVDAKREEPKFEEVKAAEAKAEESKVTESTVTELKTTEPTLIEPTIIDEAKAKTEEQPEAAKVEEPQAVMPAPAEAVAASEVPAPTVRAEETPVASPEVAKSNAESSAHDVAEEPAEHAGSHKSVFGGIDEMAKKETEVAEHTAAAWASWRRIRDTGDKPGSSKDAPSKDGSSKDASSKESKAEAPSLDDAKAAMAVAAGAEKAPEEAAAGEDSEVSAIVDSVLAEMRPRIVEEISRKLGKKK